ncbi:30S ribosomal protein S7 [Candidatus Woesebacteria bacterium]|nr:30S ribosomal protein S7 [Candidatus Woesebacteria bacterium]MCD8507650.1 30S ribosomal protein S7 [Candidatus Woesebacteria bacterium]MCD8526765.1 30S ribosomal protein S7 [Candidatus Woesebacteria bacterium]MCD8546490.1 30S ribosomal protein S7 [Candidatus Woesebacteria bacterium]
MRAKRFPRRDVKADPKFNSVVVARLINRAMRDGKKTAAQKQVYGALDLVAQTLNRKALDVLEEVLQQITPQMEVRSRRVGGASYQVPMPVSDRRGSSLAIRWLINEANKRSNRSYHTFAEKLAAEMMDALKEEGGAFQKKITTHKMADANKAFAHFRW